MELTTLGENSKSTLDLQIYIILVSFVTFIILWYVYTHAVNHHNSVQISSCKTKNLELRENSSTSKRRSVPIMWIVTV